LACARQGQKRLHWSGDRIRTCDLNTLLEAKVLIEMWGKEYKEVRPHSALGYCPGGEAILPEGMNGVQLR